MLIARQIALPVGRDPSAREAKCRAIRQKSSCFGVQSHVTPEGSTLRSIAECWSLNAERDASGVAKPVLDNWIGLSSFRHRTSRFGLAHATSGSSTKRRHSAASGGEQTLASGDANVRKRADGELAKFK
jgi:hypothetical protein